MKIEISLSLYNENPAFAHFDTSHASPFDVTASDFKRGIPKETSRESAAEVAYARSYEEPTPGSGDRPFASPGFGPNGYPSVARGR